MSLCATQQFILNFFSPPHYLIKGTIFRTNLLHIKCVLWFSLRPLSETFLILRRAGSVIIINLHKSSRKISVILVRFSWNLNFLDRFLKSPRTNLKNASPMWAELFYTEDRHDKANSRFYQVANTPKKRRSCNANRTIRFNLERY